MPKQIKIPSPRFNLKSHRDDSEETLVVLIYRYQKPSTGEKIRIVYSTGEKVIPKYWHNKTLAKVVRNHLDYSSLNDRLQDLGRTAKSIFQDHQFGEITSEEFKSELDLRTGKKKPDPILPKDYLSFMEFVEHFVNERMNRYNSKRGTWKILQTTLNHLKKYSEDRGQPLQYPDFDFTFKDEFESWLYAPKREHSTNYAAKMLSVVRQFLHEATRRGYNDKMTFAQKGWSIKKQKTQKTVLSFEELKILYDLDLSNNPKLDRVRDLFLIGCYSGLRYSDFIRIRPEHILREDGVEMIQLFTQKTDTEVVIPLMPELKTILQKYDYHSPKAISNQKLNVYLKDLFKEAEFNQDVAVKKSTGGQIKEVIVKKHQLAQSHMARRSFASNFYKLGIPAAHLMLITGHSTENQFFEYINVNKKENAKMLAKQITFLMANRVAEQNETEK